jgi:hypothetical protein
MSRQLCFLHLWNLTTLHALFNDHPFGEVIGAASRRLPENLLIRSRRNQNLLQPGLMSLE